VRSENRTCSTLRSSEFRRAEHGCARASFARLRPATWLEVAADLPGPGCLGSEFEPACSKRNVESVSSGIDDVVVVWKFDRFARSLKQLMSGLETCRALGIDFVSVTESIDTSLPSGELVFQMIGAVAQFERSLIGERVKSGLANARAKGKSLGRPPLRKLSTGETRQLRTERARRNVPFRVLAKKFGVSAHRLCAGRS